jgi:hypothetical protein
MLDIFRIHYFCNHEVERSDQFGKLLPHHGFQLFASVRSLSESNIKWLCRVFYLLNFDHKIAKFKARLVGEQGELI